VENWNWERDERDLLWGCLFDIWWRGGETDDENGQWNEQAVDVLGHLLWCAPLILEIPTKSKKKFETKKNPHPNSHADWSRTEAS
jgi:hypothetical protein